MMKEFVRDLEQFLVKYENLNNLIKMLNHEIFENIEGMPDNIAVLSDALVELSGYRINELECMVKKGLKICADQ